MNDAPSDFVLIVTIASEVTKFLNSIFNPLVFACYIPNNKCCRAEEVKQPLLRNEHLHMIQSIEFCDSQTMM